MAFTLKERLSVALAGFEYFIQRGEGQDKWDAMTVEEQTVVALEELMRLHRGAYGRRGLFDGEK